MATIRDTWTRIKPRLRQLFGVQQTLVFAGVLFYALFYALNMRVALSFLLVCVLVLGNLNYALQAASGPLYARRPFPWNWVVFLALLLVLSFLSMLGAVVLLRLMMVHGMSFGELFRQTWRLGMVLCLGGGIFGFAAAEVQRKLREKNEVLQQAVQRGSAALQQQGEELNRARDIQMDLLPKELPQVPGIEVSGAWLPARTVGGDYFDVLRLDDSRLGICIGDVSGKGITAALLMANLQAAFRAYATPRATPAEVCTKLNEFVCGNVAPGKFITFFYAILDAREHKITYENAGHCAGLLIKSNGAAEQMPGQGGVLGIDPTWTYADFSLPLSAGDRLLLFTDGVTEAADQNEVEFGHEGIIRAAGAATGSAAELKAKIMKEVEAFSHGEFRDDVTVVVACIR